MTEIVSLQEARAKGLSHYFTGKPCKHGHISRRDVKGMRCLGCASMRQNERRQRDPEWDKARHRKQKYGVDTAEFQRLMDEQDSCCAGCGKPFEGTPHIDHDHSTGVVRGLLCRKCNVALGMVDDQVGTLQNLIAYLQR